MKNTVFVRPNLKAILVAGVGLLVIQHVISSGRSQGTELLRGPVAHARELTDAELQTLHRLAREKPGSDVYVRISRAYEQRGEFKKAIQFLRRADKLAQTEDFDD